MPAIGGTCDSDGHGRRVAGFSARLARPYPGTQYLVADHTRACMRTHLATARLDHRDIKEGGVRSFACGAARMRAWNQSPKTGMHLRGLCADLSLSPTEHETGSDAPSCMDWSKTRLPKLASLT